MINTSNSYSDDSYVSEDEYVRSDSIMERLKQKNSIDLSQLNTGIEYNEGTTFSNVQGE